MQITLVIPCFNEEAAIGPCLDAVERQSRQFDEVLVVDNNSTDGTLAVVDEYRERLPIRVLAEHRQGVAWASQCGYDAASGDVVARIDADTRLEPGWANIVEEHLMSHPDIGAVGGACWFYDMSKWSMRKASFARAEKFGSNSVRQAKILAGNNMAVRKTAWLAARPHVKNLPGTHEDIDLSYALQEVGCSMAYLPGMLVGLSPRRFIASPSATMREMRAVLRTQRAHGRTKDRVLYWVNMPFIAIGLVFIGREARRTAGAAGDRISAVTE